MTSIGTCRARPDHAQDHHRPCRFISGTYRHAFPDNTAAHGIFKASPGASVRADFQIHFVAACAHANLSRTCEAVRANHGLACGRHQTVDCRARPVNLNAMLPVCGARCTASIHWESAEIGPARDAKLDSITWRNMVPIYIGLGCDCGALVDATELACDLTSPL
jgi:hypothetical protein